MLGTLLIPPQIAILRGTRTYCSSACPLSYPQSHRYPPYTITAMGIWASPSRLTYATDNSRRHHQTLDIHAHDVVNHSQNFRDPATGKHTNSVEGMKRDSQVQFCRLPSVKAAKVHNLDLEARVRLAAKSNGQRPQMMTKFMQALHSWHTEQLADFEPCSVHVTDQL